MKLPVSINRSRSHRPFKVAVGKAIVLLAAAAGKAIVLLAMASSPSEAPTPANSAILTPAPHQRPAPTLSMVPGASCSSLTAAAPISSNTTDDGP